MKKPITRFIRIKACEVLNNLMVDALFNAYPTEEVVKVHQFRDANFKGIDIMSMPLHRLFMLVAKTMRFALSINRKGGD